MWVGNTFVFKGLPPRRQLDISTPPACDENNSRTSRPLDDIMLLEGLNCALLALLLVLLHRLLYSPFSSIQQPSQTSRRHKSRRDASVSSQKTDEHVEISSVEHTSDSESTESDGYTDEERVVYLARKTILEYFKRTRVSDRFGSRKWVPEVEQKVREKLATWDLGISDRVFEKYFATGLDISSTAYRHTTIEAQVQVALCTFCTALFDDGFMGVEKMREFAPRFTAGLPQLHPVLQLFQTTMVNMREVYGPYSSNAMISSVLDFTNSEMFLRESKDMALGTPSSHYIEYIRLKEGFGEAYAGFIWPHATFPDSKKFVQAFPDSMNFINLINDMFSYYKEAKAGETGTYLHTFGKVHGLTEPQVLENIVQQTVIVVERIRAILGDSEEREAWENFAAGYTQFHLYTDRYKLIEIFPEYF
ncbi:hypothetical protein NLI96_g3782 [Meripilus lineatus]|uniref:Trichodiene synthase n=1 Tax=Meripilus lineatus TaxID=2056292 RepID=A0AAD5VB18_9APHY|nr:hypothetical protein NLI96_g3782 [Physisporinus lineatus]